MTLPDKAKQLLDGKNLVAMTTLNADGSPQTTPVWVGRDGDDILISTVKDRLKGRNVARDPRISVMIINPDDWQSYFEFSGTAVVTDDPTSQLINDLAHKYIDADYTFDPPGAQRIIVRLSPEKVVGQ
jgi:PPOX class probable F420-dependent enzyme